MLDQLIESKNQSRENRRRGSFLFTVFTTVASLFSLALIYSLFSYNLAMANDKLDLSSLVAPIPVPANAPEPIEPKIETIKSAADKPTSAKFPSRQDNFQRPEESPNAVPEVISTERTKSLARPNGPFTLSKVDTNVPAFLNGRNSDNSAGENRSLAMKPQNKIQETEEVPPPVKTPTPKTTPAPPTIIRTNKVLNGIAKHLVIPPYPAIAQSVRASGAVNVQIVIDENGNVTSANAVSGNPLLRQAAEQAARQSKFTPTFIGEQKVKVTGVIVYNFIAK